MSDESKKPLTGIRTFAGDLESERKERNLSASALEENGEAKTPKHKNNDTILPRIQESESAKIKKGPAITVPKEASKAIPKPAYITPTTDTKIPAFHELKKHIDAVKKNEQALEEANYKNDDRSTKQKPIHQSIGYDATVITDTKTGEFQLFPAIFSSIKAWFAKQKTKRRKKSTPTYSVSATSRRKGVIQRATSKSGTIFSADNETLKEQIRIRRQKESGPGSIESEDDEKEISWSPYTEPGYSLLESPDAVSVPDNTSNIAIEYRNRGTETSLQKNEPVVPIISRDETALPEAEIIYRDNLEENQTNTISESQWDTSHSEVPEEDIEYTASETQTEVVMPEEIETVNSQDEIYTERPEKSPGSLNQNNTNTLTITLLVMIIGFVVIIFAARIVLQQINENIAENNVIQINSKPILQNSQISNITITVSTLDQASQLIKSGIESAPDGLVELPIVSPVGDELSASYLFELLNFQTIPALRQSITTVRFASVHNSKPILAIQFVDINTVRGGLLNWEKTMSEDLTILYDSSDEINAKFIDETIDDIDVRILRHNDEVVIVYGFISENTAIIASSLNDFTEIVELGLIN